VILAGVQYYTPGYVKYNPATEQDIQFDCPLKAFIAIKPLSLEEIVRLLSVRSQIQRAKQ